MNIVFNENVLVLDIPQFMVSRSTMLYRCSSCTWTALLYPGTRSVPTNFNQT